MCKKTHPNRLTKFKGLNCLKCKKMPSKVEGISIDFENTIMRRCNLR